MIQYKCICQIQKYMKDGAYMTVGEKIRAYRTLRGISQKTLGELADINEVTIRKYEAGDRNPKPDQLMKLANALGVSINLFMDFDIETVSDVLSLIFKMDEQLDIDFTGDKNEKGEIDPNTIGIRFKNSHICKQLSKYAYAKLLTKNTINNRDSFNTHEEYDSELGEMRNMIEEMKQRLVNDCIVVKKGTEGIVVQNYKGESKI